METPGLLGHGNGVSGKLLAFSMPHRMKDVPLRGFKHFLPYFRQARSVYRMIKILLENSASSADNAFCISSFSNFKQAKKAACRVPMGKEARATQ